MRTGYVIRDKERRGYFGARYREDGSEPVSVYVREMDEAMAWGNLGEAKRMAKLLRAESRHPDGIRIIDPRGRVVY